MQVLPAVAKRFPTYCKKCESERYHIVLAHTGSGSAKVECEVCHRKSTFSINKKASNRFSAKKAATKTARASFNNWSEFKDYVNEEAALPYSVKTKFEEKASIKHPTFGLGLVLKSEPEKIEVAFEQGIKLLVHNR